MAPVVEQFAQQYLSEVKVIVVGSQASLERVKTGLDDLDLGVDSIPVWDSGNTLWGIWPPANNHPQFGSFSNNSRYVVFRPDGSLLDGGVWNCPSCSSPPWTPEG